MHVPTFVLFGVLLAVSRSFLFAQPSRTELPTTDVPERWAIIIVGLPGDEDHVSQFATATRAWREWLTKQLGFAENHVVVCQGAVADESSKTQAATRDAIAQQCETLSAQLKPEDGLWLFVLGHGDFDGTAAHVHLPGPDPDAADFAEWLAPFQCREQILWLTHCCAGYWLPRLSRPGRIVVTATTADAEVNETEFPYALATVAGRAPQELDLNSDQCVTFEELLAAIDAETRRRFESNQRLPTEHAQLDDNGDVKGTELGTDPDADRPPDPLAANIQPDGEFSRTMVVPYRTESWKPREALPPAPSTSDPPAPAK